LSLPSKTLFSAREHYIESTPLWLILLSIGFSCRKGFPGADGFVAQVIRWPQKRVAINAID